MTYVITEACVEVKDKSCIDECPVDCIYEGARMPTSIPTSALIAERVSRSARSSQSTTKIRSDAVQAVHRGQRRVLRGVELTGWSAKRLERCA